MGAAAQSRWSRALVLAGTLGFVAWGVATVAGAGRATTVPLALYGFVFPVLFGKGYSLLPAYFDRELAVPRAPLGHLPLAVGGAIGLAAAGAWRGDGAPLAEAVWYGRAGSALWAAGTVVFAGSLLWTVRDNLTGAETGTGEHNTDRRPVDRYANAFVPVVLAYLLVGSYAELARVWDLPLLLDGYGPQASHLLAAGTALLALFAVGARLLPRFLVARPPRTLVYALLPAGALGPALIAADLQSAWIGGGTLLHAGAGLEALAVGGFAATYWVLFARSDRRRVGFYGVLAGTVAGVGGTLLAFQGVFAGLDAALVTAHWRLNLVGLLGLSIVGVTYQFYPPAVGEWPGAGDRGAYAVLGLLSAGLAASAGGELSGAVTVASAGEWLLLAGAAGHAYLLVGAFAARWRT